MEKSLRSHPKLAWDTLLAVDDDRRAGPLYVRLTNALRDAMRSGRFPTGSALPASRQLADDLGCSRWVVTEAYEQLVAEGYLEAQVGSATRVRGRDHRQPEPASTAAIPVEPPGIDLRPGLGDLRSFPRIGWMRAQREAVTGLPHGDLAYPPAGGHPRLRRVLAEYLHRVRGADVSDSELTITSGILDGITQLTRVMADSGFHSIAIENPCWSRLFEGVRRTNLEVVPIAVDSKGIKTDQLRRAKVQAVIVAPAHQFPTGAVLVPERRAELLDWAATVDGLILEDDYDAEFRYDRRPIGALQGIDSERVAYFGSLSKTLAPAVGLGWMLTPRRWTEALRSNQARVTGPSVLEQLALARFIENGGYDRHLRILRRKYRSRRDHLVEALRSKLPECQTTGVAAGLHIVLRLPQGLSGAAVVAAARARSVRVSDLRAFMFPAPGPIHEAGGQPIGEYEEGLVIGYGNLDDALIEQAVGELALAARTVRRIAIRARSAGALSS